MKEFLSQLVRGGRVFLYRTTWNLECRKLLARPRARAGGVVFVLACLAGNSVDHFQLDTDC